MHGESEALIQNALIEQNARVGALFVDASGGVHDSPLRGQPIAVGMWQAAGVTMENNLFEKNAQDVVDDFTVSEPFEEIAPR